MPIIHVPEVEHMISRKHGGDRTAWSNLLLGCKYCNSRKDAKTTPENMKEYLWPDADNTAVAFSYANGIPMVNEDTLRELDPTGICYEKAKYGLQVLMKEMASIVIINGNTGEQKTLTGEEAYIDPLSFCRSVLNRA